MKKILFVAIVIFNVACLKAQEGIEFFHGTFAEAVEKAQKENKLIFMDAFAEWCGPCKRMAATTFKDEKVGKFFNDNFINVKMDMEKGEGPGLQRKYEVTAYPTLLFINGKSELAHKGVGGMGNDQLIALARTAMGKVDNSKEFEKAYNERDTNFGNGRFVRNIFEKTLEKQANRIAGIPNINKEILTTISEEDIP